jgi:hypothetical protein
LTTVNATAGGLFTGITIQSLLAFIGLRGPAVENHFSMQQALREEGKAVCHSITATFATFL